MGFEGPSTPDEVHNFPEAHDTEAVLPSRLEDLPPLKTGYMRLVHLTSQQAAEQIVSTGLDYSAQGMVSSTAEAFSTERINIETDDTRFNGATSAVIIDMPFELHKLHNNPTQAPGIISPEYIVGIVARSGSEPHVFKKRKSASTLDGQGEVPQVTGYGYKSPSSRISSPVDIPSASQPGSTTDSVW
jgi:hypothetical protein